MNIHKTVALEFFKTTTNIENPVTFLNLNCYLAIYAEFFLIFGITSLLLFLVILDYSFKYKIILIKIAANITSYILVLILLLINNNYSNFYLFDYLLIQDSFSIFIKNILILTFLLAIHISTNYITLEKITQYEYFILLGLAFLGLFTLVGANDLITFYLGIELQSLAFYILAAFKIYSNFSTEAGLKYFILGAFSSGLLLFGCSLIYGFSGTTNFYDLKLLLLGSELPLSIFLGIVVGSIFIIIGILFKLGAAPFHMWLPDVYEGVPTSITAIFAIVPKIAIFSVFLRLNFSLLFIDFPFWQELLTYSGLSSIVIGTFGALYQTKLKRLLAYSAISHVGFLLIGFISLSTWSIFSLIFYLLVYIIISINIFSVILSIRKRTNNIKIKKINELIILFKSNKTLAINFALILFSIAGIPPLAGFYSKFYIFVSAIKADVYVVALIAAILSVIGCLYYIRLIKLLFFKITDYWAFFFEISKTNSLIISISLFFNIFFFFYPELFTIYIYNLILNNFI